jgi:hypothetical protein
VDALAGHVWNLANLGYLDEAREAALELPDRDISTNSVRNNALIHPARRCAAIGALRAGLDCALSVPDDNDRSDALAGYAEAAAPLAPTVLLPTVRAVLGRAPTLSRRSLLTDLGAFAPVIARVGAQQAIEDIATAIEDAARWWP